jgi:hypothetical protein
VRYFTLLLLICSAVDATEFQVKEEGEGIRITYVSETPVNLIDVYSEVDAWLSRKGLTDADRMPMLRSHEFAVTIDGRYSVRLPHFFTTQMRLDHKELLDDLKAHLEKEFRGLEAQPAVPPNDDHGYAAQSIAHFFSPPTVVGLLVPGGDGFGSNSVDLVGVIERPERPSVVLLEPSDSFAFGDLEDVVRAALENREPTYLAELMDALAENVKRLFEGNKHVTQRERLALLVAIASLMRDADSVMVLASSDGINDLPDAEAKLNVRKVHHDSSFHEVSQQVQRAVGIAFLNADRSQNQQCFVNEMDCLGGNIEVILEQGRKSRVLVRRVASDVLKRGAMPEQVARVAYRVAQLQALNFILLRELDRAYARVLERLRPVPNNPLVNLETWDNLKSDCFKHLRGERAVLIEAWLKSFDASFPCCEHDGL